MSIKPKMRFEVFKRDLFRCIYCNRTPPEVTLEVDHLQAKSKGGKDEIENLVTACFECNRGKSNNELTIMPETVNKKLEIIKEKEKQLEEYRKFIKSIRKRLEEDVNQIERQIQIYFPNQKFTEETRKTIKNFLQIIDLYEIIEAVDIAFLKIDNLDRALSYFFGVCWNKIKTARGK